MIRQSAIENINIASDYNLRRKSSGASKNVNQLHPLSPEVFITPQSSVETWQYVTPQTSVEAQALQTQSCPLKEENVKLNAKTISLSNLAEKRDSLDLSFSSSKQFMSEFHFSSNKSNSDELNDFGEGIDKKKQKKKKKKKKKDSDIDEEEEQGVDVLPILGGFSIAIVVGAPVYIVSNIKLAMFSAIGGGIMGYTTGKMFSDWG